MMIYCPEEAVSLFTEW